MLFDTAGMLQQSWQPRLQNDCKNVMPAADSQTKRNLAQEYSKHSFVRQECGAYLSCVAQLSDGI